MIIKSQKLFQIRKLFCTIYWFKIRKFFFNIKTLIHFLKINDIVPDYKILVFGIFKNKQFIQEKLDEKINEDYLDSEKIFFIMK